MVDGTLERKTSGETKRHMGHATTPSTAYLLAFLDDALPQILPTRQKIFESISNHFLDRLLRPASSIPTSENGAESNMKTLTRLVFGEDLGTACVLQRDPLRVVCAQLTMMISLVLSRGGHVRSACCRLFESSAWWYHAQSRRFAQTSGYGRTT